MSLHPRWQRRIVNTLTTIFPKVQFICASHSPFLIQSLKDGQLISMRGIVDEEYSGQSIEDIAENIMGVENPQYSDEKQRMYELAVEHKESKNSGGALTDWDNLLLACTYRWRSQLEGGGVSCKESYMDVGKSTGCELLWLVR